MSAKPTPAKKVPMYCLTLMEYRGDREMRYGEIEVATDVFQAMQKNVNADDDASFSKMLARGLAEMTKPVDSCALENAVAANNALAQLLAENMEFRRVNSGSSSFDGMDVSATLCFGILQLVQLCRDRLNQAANLI